MGSRVTSATSGFYGTAEDPDPAIRSPRPNDFGGLELGHLVEQEPHHEFRTFGHARPQSTRHRKPGSARTMARRGPGHQVKPPPQRTAVRRPADTPSTARMLFLRFLGENHRTPVQWPFRTALDTISLSTHKPGRRHRFADRKARSAAECTPLDRSARGESDGDPISGSAGSRHGTGRHRWRPDWTSAFFSPIRARGSRSGAPHRCGATPRHANRSG